MACPNKNREAQTFSKDFKATVSVPDVIENGLVEINMDELYLSASRVQYLKEKFIDALRLPGTPTEYRLIGVEEEKEQEIDESTTIQDIYQYVLTGRFIMEKMPKQD